MRSDSCNVKRHLMPQQLIGCVDHEAAMHAIMTCSMLRIACCLQPALLSWHTVAQLLH